MCMNTVKKYCVMGGRQVGARRQPGTVHVYTCVYTTTLQLESRACTVCILELVCIIQCHSMHTS